jgi:HlyD family secretion protein
MNSRDSSTQKDNFLNTQCIETKNSDDWETPQILSPPVTIAISILGAGVSALLIWSLVYELPITATGTGLIYQSPRLIGVRAAAGGLLKHLNVKVGEEIRTNSVLGELDVKDQEVMLAEARMQTQLANSDNQLATNLIPSELSEQIQANQKLLKDYKRNIAQQQSILAAQTRNLLAYKNLEKKGFVSSVELLSYQEKAIELQNSIGQTRSQYNKLLAEEENTKRQLSSALNSAKSKFENARATEKVRRYKLEQAQSLRSPIPGTVVQITTWPGDTVAEGQELFVVSPEGSPLTAAFLMTSQDAGKIKIGDAALISPQSAPPQRYGYIKGKVINISPYPTTKAAYASLIGSETLADQVYESQEAKMPILVEVAPIYDNGKLKWTGSDGPAWKISSGTLTKIKVIYHTRKPITYVIPWLRQITGLSEF